VSETPVAATYFISYSRADQDFALRFAGDLRARGVAIWVDQLDIRPSEHWDRAIERAVRDCRGLVVILSPRSVASDNVADEISFAIDHGKSVLPVMIERCQLPLRIARMQVIDATGDYTRALELCVDAISSEGANRSELARHGDGVADRDAISAAKTELATILGPIASILVDKDAKQAGSLADFYARLAAHIPDAQGRERFTAARRSPAAPRAPLVETRGKASLNRPVANSEVDRIGAILTHYLGPIATIVAKRESAAAVSAEDLQHRLALRILDEGERTEFLDRVRAV
jgi:hypothetical protein